MCSQVDFRPAGAHVIGLGLAIVLTPRSGWWGGTVAGPPIRRATPVLRLTLPILYDWLRRCPHRLTVIFNSGRGLELMIPEVVRFVLLNERVVAVITGRPVGVRHTQGDTPATQVALHKDTQ